MMDNCVNCKHYRVWIDDDKKQTPCCVIKGSTKELVHMMPLSALGVSGKDCWEYNKELDHH